MKTLLAIHDVDQTIDSLGPVVAFAKEMGAHLNVVVMGMMHSVAAVATPGAPVYYYDDYNREIVESCKIRMGEVETMVQEAELSASVTMECKDPGVIEGTVLGHALLTDVTVFASRSVLAGHSREASFNGALSNSGRPILILGADNKPIPPIKTVMFAWNGSPQSAKATHHSLPLLPEGVKAHVVVVDPDEYKTGPNPGDDVAAFLARKGLQVTVDRLPSVQRDPSDVLLRHAKDIGADLLVMGAYGHSRFREWLLGGTTRYVLERADLPVLMAH